MTLRIVMAIGLLFLGQLAEAAKDEDLKKLEDILEKKEEKQITLDLQGADMRSFNLDHPKDNGRIFKGSIMKKANFSGMTLKDMIFESVDLEGANFENTRLISVKFVDCHLKDATFKGATYRYGSFRGSNLQGTSFEGAELESLSYSGAILIDTLFTDAKLFRVSFEHTKEKENVSFESADLKDCSGTGFRLF